MSPNGITDFNRSPEHYPSIYHHTHNTLGQPLSKALQRLQTDVTHSPYLAARHPDPSPRETESHFLKRHTPYQPRDPTTSNMAESLLQTRLRIGARCSICDLVSGKQIERDSIAL